MPKKIKFEAFKYRFLAEAENSSMASDGGEVSWKTFVENLTFTYETGNIRIASHINPSISVLIPVKDASFYSRGDTSTAAERQIEDGHNFSGDRIETENAQYFRQLVEEIGREGKFIPADQKWDRITSEREFHDSWAESEDLSDVDVRRSNEVCTAPEMRYIVRKLGDLRGKRILDVGCGLGEASVYFAMLGADVTAADLSPGMLEAASKLASMNGVNIHTHLASAEDMGLSGSAEFDVIYVGNLLHHVDIQVTLDQVLPHLAKDGLFVSWDPVAYNPAINVYRRMATEVRTEDEHPLTAADLKLIRGNFRDFETRFFWLTTLIVFVVMAVIQRRDPNKERYWKVILKEGPKWAWLYKPLEMLDRFLLSVIPALGWLCWNVVIIGRAAAGAEDRKAH